MLRVLRGFWELRVMVSGILSSPCSLVWAITLLCFRKHVFAMWQERRTAKIYIDLAVSDAAAFSFPPWGERRLHRAVAALPQLLEEACHGRRARGLGGGGLA